jgi:hypothetical protein
MTNLNNIDKNDVQLRGQNNTAQKPVGPALFNNEYIVKAAPV